MSQEDKPGTHKSQRKIARDLGIARLSVQNITKELKLKPFKHIKVSRRDKTVKQNRKTCSKKLYSRYSKQDVKRLVFTDEKEFPYEQENNGFCRGIVEWENEASLY